MVPDLVSVALRGNGDFCFGASLVRVVVVEFGSVGVGFEFGTRPLPPSLVRLSRAELELLA